MILTAAYACLSAAISSQKLIEPRAEAGQSARVAMAIMTADLRAACPLSKDFAFLGMHRMVGEVEADNLDFATHNYTPTRPREGDFCEVSFFVEKDAETGQCSLWRRRNPRIALDPLSGGSRGEIARGVRGVRFEYYDGVDWFDTWGETGDRRKDKKKTGVNPGNLYGMPEAVRITLSFDSAPPSKTAPAVTAEAAALPLVFQTVVRLELAASSRPTSASAASSSAGDDKTGQTPPGAGNPERN